MLIIFFNNLDINKTEAKSKTPTKTALTTLSS